MIYVLEGMPSAWVDLYKFYEKYNFQKDLSPRVIILWRFLYRCQFYNITRAIPIFSPIDLKISQTIEEINLDKYRYQYIKYLQIEINPTEDWDSFQKEITSNISDLIDFKSERNALIEQLIYPLPKSLIKPDINCYLSGAILSPNEGYFTGLINYEHIYCDENAFREDLSFLRPIAQYEFSYSPLRAEITLPLAFDKNNKLYLR